LQRQSLVAPAIIAVLALLTFGAGTATASHMITGKDITDRGTAPISTS
jgi:hypothetical protein